LERRRVIAAISAFGWVVSFPLAWAQQAKIWRIGFLANDPTIPTTPPGKAFLDGLRDQGFVEGKNLVIERRFAEGKVDVLPSLAAELVRLGLDVIVASSVEAALAVKNATKTIPIVMMNVTDPVSFGIVPKLGSPQGNLTGFVNDVSPDVAGKRLQLLKDAIPKLSRVAVLMNPESRSDKAQWDMLRRAAPSLGVTVHPVAVREGSEFADAIGKMNGERPDALLSTNNGLNLTYRRVIVAFATARRLPTMHAFTEATRDGGLMSYAVNRADTFRRAAGYVAKILNGAKPADLPIEQPNKLELVINLKTAKILGVKIPPSLLLRADEVIE
jgi:putative ABC transport system substrate-binding protein